MNNKPSFLTFAEAIVAARREPGIEFVGLGFNPPGLFLSVYGIQVDPEEPDQVNVNYSGGDLFDLGGEEDYYDDTSVPAEAKKLLYARKSELGNGNPGIDGMCSEFVLAAVLPGLSEPDTYANEEAFMTAASQTFKDFWRKA